MPGGTAMGSDRTEKLAKVNYWDELLALRDRQREQTRERHAGHQAVGAAARDQPAGPDALVPAPRDQGHRAVDLHLLPAGDPARQPLRPAQIPGRSGDHHPRRQGLHHARRRQTSLGRRATCSTCRCAATASSCSISTPIRTSRRVSSPPNRTGSNAPRVDRGSGFEQLEDAPEYRRERAKIKE